MQVMRATRFTDFFFRARLPLGSSRTHDDGIGGRVRQSLAVPFAIALIWGVGGCGSLEPVPTYEQLTDPAKMFMALEIDHRAIALSTAPTYNTFQLTAVPKNALGEPMDGLSTPVFRLVNDEDSTQVTVTPAGLLTAKSATPDEGVAVLAELRTGDNVRRTDTAFVQVTTDPAPPILASLSIDPVAPDSAVWPIGYTQSLTKLFLWFAGMIPDIGNPSQVKSHLLDTANNPVTGLRIEYTSLDSAVAVVDRWTGQGHGIHPGHARMVARTTAYGVTKADTLLYTITWPVYQDMIFSATGLAPSDAWLAPNGLALWFNGLQVPIEVTFDNPTNVAGFPRLCTTVASLVGRSGDCGPGNFSLPVPGQPGENGCLFFAPWCYNAIRQFPIPGVYPYRTSTGVRGRIVVTSDTTIS